MAPAKPIEDSIKLLVVVVKNCEGFKLDYKKVAGELGINTANNAQRRFKKLVEDAGFGLVNGAVVDAAAVPRTPTKRTEREPSIPAKKRKGNTVKNKDEDGAAAEKKDGGNEGIDEDED